MDEQKELIEARKVLEDATKRLNKILNQGDEEPKEANDFTTLFFLCMFLFLMKPPTPFPGGNNNWPGRMN